MLSQQQQHKMSFAEFCTMQEGRAMVCFFVEWNQTAFCSGVLFCFVLFSELKSKPFLTWLPMVSQGRA